MNNSEDFGHKVLGVLVSILKNDNINCISLRQLATKSNFTERETELGIQFLLSKNLVENIEGFIDPESMIQLTNDAFVYDIPLKLKKHEMKETHIWKRSAPSFGTPGTAEAMMRNKMYPMGGWCVKCGLHSMNFNTAPSICPKYEKPKT